MIDIPVKELDHEISKRLLNSRHLKKYNIDKAIIEEELHSENYIENLSNMIINRDFSCKSVLKLSENLINKLSNGNLPENFLKYLYEYTLYKSFPDAVTIGLNEELNVSCEITLRILKAVSKFQKVYGDNTWQSKYPMEFLSKKEEDELEYYEEYDKFLRAFKKEYVYEMMKLNGEVYNYNTLDHICGVHYLALFIGRQLKNKGLPIDLGRVSGAAAGHDIGKYGCKGRELKRVPHLHYYYTDQWFKKQDINYIRNIAINHSTWDLELENLSLESLILIYSDFRVKNRETYNEKASTSYEMHIFSLKDSFNVILEKLENMDDKKEKRYKRVYAKLKDFEDYLIDLGVNVDVDLNNDFLHKEEKIKLYPLMYGNDIINNLKYLTINHNINLMYKLRDEYSLDKILEHARSEKEWKNLREYIGVFEEYSTYLTQKQKMQTIKFLFENLTHSEDDIRRHCAELIGTLIAIFDEDYRKEMPENVAFEKTSTASVDLLYEYLGLFLYPSHKIISGHRSWIGYSARIMLNSLFKNCQKSMISTYRKILLQFFNNNYNNIETQLYLLETAKYVPMDPYDDELDIVFNYILSMVKKRNSSLKLSALETIYNLIPKVPHESTLILNLTTYLLEHNRKSKMAAENLLKYKIVKLLNLTELTTDFQYYCKGDNKKVSEIFLSNLKSATEWVRKKNQIELLVNFAIIEPNKNALHTAIHFCNLLKVSAIETVRNKAGIAILKIMPFLSLSERNEVAVELLRALEIEGHKFTEYIPSYLGKVLLFLEPKELDEIFEDLRIKIKIANFNVKPLILKTVGVCIANYSSYNERFKEKEELSYNRLIKMLGIVLNGLVDYNLKVKQAAIRVIGKDIFGCKTLSLIEKGLIFDLIAKKVLNLLTENKNEELIFLSNAATLNHIYRFISDYSFFIGNIELSTPKKVAFFPGTFDPFSLSHKEITKSIRDKGFEVYLAVDEFSWSKKTLPNLLRKTLLNMSIADELNIYVYPEEYPTNIANEEDLIKLKDNFKDASVYIMVGSDVILNASSYKKPKTQNSIHTFNHIVFERGKNKELQRAVKSIEGEVIFYNLPANYSSISSTQIRHNIDENRDISSLVDPLAEQYIYENGFYQREPLNKIAPTSSNIDIEFIEEITEEIIEQIVEDSFINKQTLRCKLQELKEKNAAKIVMLKNSFNGHIIGFSAFHWVRSNVLYKELQDDRLSDYIRNYASGRIILIDAMFLSFSEKYKSLEQILITETLAYSISKDYEYAVFRPIMKELASEPIYETLKLQGFTEIDSSLASTKTLIVNMSNPCVLNLDIENIIKEPFRSNINVKQTIINTRKKLQSVITSIYPGELVLSFDTDILHQSMIKKVCTENKVPSTTTEPKISGDNMCVPYGDILDRFIVPNTVTKALHTEKFFEPDVKSFKIGEFPYYLTLENQVKMIKSFKRPVILVDNILHKGYRLRELEPIFKKEDIAVKKIIAGILSGRGKDIMDMQNIDIDSVYFIPKLNIWFNENTLYPFIGGDALWRGEFPKRNLIPSINLILPYTNPVFIRNANPTSLYNLSKVCLENAMDILKVLENEYHVLYLRNLTLSSLGEVFTIPRCPDKGRDIEYDLYLNPSYYLESDLEILRRFENML